LLILFGGLTNLYGQKTEGYGNVSIKEFSNEAFAKDTAAAVVLFDVGSLELDPGSTTGSVYRRHMRVKILKKQAFNEWGNQRFYVGISGNLKVKGTTYNLENGVIKKFDVEESSIMKSKYDRETEQIVIAFPNVREGSVVEFSYVRTYEELYVPRLWTFQHSIPSRRSEFTLSVPIKNLRYRADGSYWAPAKEVVHNLNGPLIPVENEKKYDGGYYRWLFTNIPAFVPEPLMPDDDPFTSYVAFAMRYLDWKSLYYEVSLDATFGEIVRRHKFLEKTAEELTAGFVDERQKIKAISDYVKQNVQYTGVNDNWGTNPNELLDKKKGSSGDINLLLGSLLQKAGLKVNMVLLSTRDHGTIDKKVPALWQFNYVVCEVSTKDGDILVDATEKLLPYDMLPSRCFNQTGFLVGTDQFGWIPVDPTKRDKVLLDATVTFTESGGLKGKVKSYKEGYAAFDVRKKYSEGGEKDYKIDLGNKLWNIEKHEIKNVLNIEKPLEEACDISIDDYVIQANDKMYFNPHLFLREEANPFAAESRKYPIDFEKLIDKTVVCNLVIPPNYSVEELPENKVLVLPGNAGKCIFSTTVNGSNIQVMSKLTLNKTFFLPAEYAYLREFYGKVVAKKAENIVLKQKQ